MKTYTAHALWDKNIKEEGGDVVRLADHIRVHNCLAELLSMCTVIDQSTISPKYRGKFIDAMDYAHEVTKDQK